MPVIYTIQLPQHVNEQDFERFMREEVFPAMIEAGPTRLGQVSEIRFFKGDTVGHTNEYLWLVDGVLGIAPGILDQIATFGAQASAVGRYAELEQWPSQADQ